MNKGNDEGVRGERGLYSKFRGQFGGNLEFLEKSRLVDAGVGAQGENLEG